MAQEEQLDGASAREDLATAADRDEADGGGRGQYRAMAAFSQAPTENLEERCGRCGIHIS